MSVCDLLAKQSYCERAQMGSVIIVDEKTLITGYNGTLEGFENKCDDISLVCNVCNVVVNPDEYIEGEKHCKKGYVEKRPKTNGNVIHAETNAILHAGNSGIKIVDKTITMTTSPCQTCANNIVKAKLKKVIFGNYHDDLSGLATLIKAGVEVYHYMV
jgi:dCMP deaminase